ncbi:MAG: acetyl-CoA decarbonylase/synthase complex subunit gamma [Spirochaetaceae bacterium]|jgi:acetyl-CoA decarbonylase/synthase complex subunit gamma|nr:acetyl-CoA decarbonylase/synthase complex subunit gamma [Spirochaetaceae bacterium]
MALKGLDYFKFTPKTNCKACGCPTCMAFSMKVAQGGTTIDKCPHIKPEDLAKLSEASAPPMKKYTVGTGKFEFNLGGETVLFRHEKTFVSKCLFGVNVTGENVDKVLEQAKKVDYVRIGERMFSEVVNVEFTGDKGKFLDAVKKANSAERVIVLDCQDAAAAKEALDICKANKPILNGANESNAEAMSKIAVDAGVLLGVRAANLEALYDTVQKIEASGNKDLVLDVGTKSIKDAFNNAVEIRRTALNPKGGDRSFGYPSIVNLSKLSGGNDECEVGLASIFTLKYGSIIIMSSMTYAKALPLYGLRQNIYTDPQKPMRVEPGIYPLNGADENSICATTVDFALSYFVASAEFERSGIPVNLLISDAGGYSVLTAWAAGKLSANSIAKFIKEKCEDKCKNKILILPGKVAVLKGELEELLSGWKVVVGPAEAVGIVKFLKDMAA